MGLALRQLGGEDYFLNDYLISTNIAAGAAMVLEASAAAVGEAKAASAAAAPDFLGCAMDSATYNATPTEEPSQVRQENLVRLAINPGIIWRFAVAGGTASGTPLQPATATPANILLNDTLDATKKIITDTAVGAIDMSGGIVKGRLGRNVGAVRKLSAFATGASQTAGIPFVNALAVGDQFIRLPFSRMSTKVTLTTDATWANGIVAAGAGADFLIVNVVVDEVRARAWVDIVSRDSAASPEGV